MSRSVDFDLAEVPDNLANVVSVKSAEKVALSNAEPALISFVYGPKW